MSKTKEFQAFDNMMGELLKVPHSEIKEKLDAEKQKKDKRKAAKKSSERAVSRDSGEDT